ncbi:MAG: hypothetical protein Q9162_004237 [Coniocarpon cinnabarinum]
MLENVVKVSRRDTKANNHAFVLIHTVQQTDSSSMTIEGTESEYAYKTTVKPSDLKRFRAQAFHGPDTTLTDAVAWVLLGKDPSKQAQEIALSAEAVVSVHSGKRIELTVRRRIEGITSELCTISLPATNDEIQIYDWMSTSATQLADATKERRQLLSDIQDRDADLQRLRHQLSDFAEVKQSHENALLEKFRQLVNSKKLKIRDQQRLLAGAKLDANLDAKVSTARGTSAAALKRNEPGSAKRKVVDVKEESDSSGRFEDDSWKHREANDATEDEKDGSLETSQDSDMENFAEAMHEPNPGSENLQRFARQPPAQIGNELPPKRMLPFQHRFSDDATSGESRKPVGGDEEVDTEEEL